MKEKNITVALVGNPNTGKSTIFNNITGINQHIANYPGVTVEKKEGKISYKEIIINFVDLPGTYSLSVYSEDEIIARDFIFKKKPDIIVHIIDASNLERNLYLYTQICELNIPIILAMNMDDIVKNKGISINYNEIGNLLGKSVVILTGNKNIGTNRLIDEIYSLYKNPILNKNLNIDYGQKIEKEIENISKNFKNQKNIIRWLIVKLLENDKYAIKMLKSIPNSSNIMSSCDESKKNLENEFKDDIKSIIANSRYSFINKICKKSVDKSSESKKNISDKIDKFVMNKFLAFPIFAIVMYSIFAFTFRLSEMPINWLETAIEWMSLSISNLMPEGLLKSFIIDGLIAGVGGVLGFFPLILFMFFSISFFEDSGYMVRAAFLMDRFMSKFGLNGKSFLPMMISTGCAVPGIMATRSFDNKKDKLITMLVTPFMICGAKLPVLALFIAVFFTPYQGPNVMFSMYMMSIVIAFGSSLILQKFIFKKDVSHFIMEIPPYRIPALKSLFIKMWHRGYQYIKKAGGIIFLVSIIIWAGFSFPLNDSNLDEKKSQAVQIKQSYAGRLGQFIEPVLKPIGMDWKSSIAIISGFAAKEVIVSTFGTIYSLGKIDIKKTQSLQKSMRKDPSWTPLKAFSFLIFSLIYAPCFAVISVFYKESGSNSKWTLFLFSWTTLMAWIISFLIYQIGNLLGF